VAETYNGDYAPELFNENKHYYLLQAQEKTTLTDAELRDLNSISNTYTRKFIQKELGDAVAIRDAYKIEQGSTPSDRSNNFIISGSDSTGGPSTFYLQGYRLFLNSDIKYTDQTRYTDYTSAAAITRDGYTSTILPSLTTPTGALSDLKDIALAGSNVFSCGDGSVIRTTDFGRNWIDKTSGMTAPVNFKAVSFNPYDDSNGYVVGNNGVAYMTTNAGATWVKQNIPTAGPLTSSDLNDIDIFDVNYAMAASTDGTVFNYNMGTWVTQITSITSEDLYGIAAPDTNNCWAVGETGTIINTADSGSNWILQPSNVTCKLNRIVAIDSAHLYVVGNDGTALRTDDSGNTWTPIFAGTTVNLNGLYFSDMSNGWAVGDNGVLTQTTDAGFTWSARTIADGVNFTGITFKDSTGFIAGSSGKIYRTLDGTNWELYRTDRVYIDFHLAEVAGDASSEYYDPGIVDSTIGLPSANRLRIVSDVKVSEGWPIPGNYSPDGTVQHYTTQLASIQRYVDQSSIAQADITDFRKVVRTVAEIDYAMDNGGIDTSAIADSAITPSKILSTGDYTVGSILVTGDASINGNLTVDGDAFYHKDLSVGDLNVSGRAILGDSTRPYDATHYIYGAVVHMYDGSATAPAYNLQVLSPLDSTPVFNIASAGSGQIFQIKRDNTDSSSNMIDATNLGSGYGLNFYHAGRTGGILKACDDATGDSITITKGCSGSVFNITTTSADPTFTLSNIASSSTSIYIDQSSGTILSLNSSSDATSIGITSQGQADDIHIIHSGSQGVPINVASSSFQGSMTILNNAGKAVYIKQTANETLMSLDKTGSGLGLALEVNNRGGDVGLGVYNTGSGPATLISHVGDSTQPGLDIFVAGTESGAALRINKSNDETGEAIRVWNQGYSDGLYITQDRTDSSAAVIHIDNNYDNLMAFGYDITSNNWNIDKAGNIFVRGDVSCSSVVFDASHYIEADAACFDRINFDTSNPGISGQLFVEAGFLRMSDGASPMPSPGFGATGVQGVTGVIGIQGETGAQGEMGFQGVTGLQGETGIQGLQGQTGIQGLQGQTGIQGLRGETGIQGETGAQGEMGFQGVTGLQGETGIQGLQGQTGIQGLQGQTGIQGLRGETGIQGLQGETGIQGQTGIQGYTGVQMGATGAINFIMYTVPTSMLVTGIQGDITLPFAIKLNSWQLLAGTTGIMTVDLWINNYANFPPISANAMHSGATGPWLSNAIKNTGTTTGWGSPTGAQGDIIRVNIEGVTGISMASLSLNYNKL